MSRGLEVLRGQCVTHRACFCPDSSLVAMEENGSANRGQASERCGSVNSRRKGRGRDERLVVCPSSQGAAMERLVGGPGPSNLDILPGCSLRFLICPTAPNLSNKVALNETPTFLNQETTCASSRTTIQRINVLGVGISVLNLQSALDAVADAIAQRRKGYICITGVHGVTEAQDDPAFRRILNEAFL